MLKGEGQSHDPPGRIVAKTTEASLRIFRESGARVSLKKPDPYMLDRIPGLIGRPFNDCYYLWDRKRTVTAVDTSPSLRHREAFLDDTLYKQPIVWPLLQLIFYPVPYPDDPVLPG
jgi:hypothetical protein